MRTPYMHLVVERLVENSIRHNRDSLKYSVQNIWIRNQRDDYCICT